MDIDDSHIGGRIREVRAWRQMSMTATAGLAGMSPAYLSLIERGLRPVTKRATLERLANALRVSPMDLVGAPYAPVDPAGNAAHAALDDIETALTEWYPGELPDGAAVRPWGLVDAELTRLTDVLRPRSDYASQGEMLPQLIRDLLFYSRGEHRANALVGLMSAYYTAGNVAARMGKRPLTYLAGERVRAAAELLDQPQWSAVAAWVRAQFLSAASRPRQYELAVAAMDVPGARLESRGMSHLTAAMAAAAQGQADTARSHLDAAEDMAKGIEPAPAWDLGTLHFSPANVGTWRVAIGTELGDGGRVAEIARHVDWATMPVSRQGAFWTDLGRALLQDKKSRDQGLKSLLKAEELAPQQVRINPFVREAVSDMLRQVRRDAAGRELRGLAYRVGLAPTG